MDSYGMINANTKFQVQSDSLLLDRKLRGVVDATQFFCYRSNRIRKFLVAKIAGGVLVTEDN